MTDDKHVIETHSIYAQKTLQCSSTIEYRLHNKIFINILT